MKKNHKQKFQKILDFKILNWKDGRYLNIQGAINLSIFAILVIGFMKILCIYTDCERQSQSFRAKFEKHQYEVEQRAIQNQAESIAKDYVNNIGK